MKTGHNYFRIVVCLLVALVCNLPERAYAANDFLEEKQNYTVTPKGNGVLHFKIPIWSYGWQNNYRWGSPSVVWYSDSYHAGESNSVTRFFNIRSSDKQNTSDPKVSSSAEVDLSAGEGTVKITRTADGGTMQINPGSGTKSVSLPAQTSLDGSYKRVVYIEFDWYLPESLTSKQFYVGIDYWLYKYDADDSNSGNQYKHIWYAFPNRMDGSDPLMVPELQSPYLYFMNDNGDPMRDGKAAIPYVVYQEPKYYTTTVSPSPIMTNSRAGVIIVPTSDSIRREFQATFTVQPNTDISTTTSRSTNKIDIPAFHRLYDLAAIEQQDEHGSYNGKNKLQWNIRNALAEDLVATDYFEVQRATKQDFSDAQTITLLPMESGKDSYQFEDDTRGMNAVTTGKDSSTLYKELVWRDYMLTDDEGEPMYEMYLRLVAKKQVLPASPLYYRVRRASTSAWDWDHPFAQSATLYKHSYLAPLAATQPDYTLDKDFSQNHLVHFNININNAPINESSFGLQDCELERYFTASRGKLDSVILTVDLDERVYYTTERVLLRYSAAGFERTLEPGKNVITVPVKDEGTLQIWVEITNNTAEFNGYEQDFALATYTMDRAYANILDGKVVEIRMTRQGHIYNGMWDCEARAVMYGNGEATYGMTAAQQRWEQVKDEVKQVLYDSLIHSSNSSAAFGRCMWDRGAQLILMRTMQETGTTIEMIVPQDSIRRNADGSWTAHVTDVANMACTNYSYSVRIDPSNADLRFQSKESEQPIAIHGASLYFNEAAAITSFTATQGDAARERKNGVLLQWIPSSAAVDEYVLMRVPTGSTNAPDTIYRGKENNWFDTSAAPGVHYEYTVVSHYECQGKHTDNSATAEGWRTPYGEIGGNVRQTDNSGMAGVQVSLSAGNQTLRTLTTDAAGAYLFDSLEYGAGTQYVVSVTSQYGEFSYNGTQSGSAAITLAADNCVQQGIEFINTSCVRLSGRVLYAMSTIPVSGVCFLLNGDTVKRGATVYTSGIDGNFELTIPKSMPCRLQVSKAGHTFANDGWLFVTGTDSTFSLVKALDGVRFYDRTKVRLVGRIAGGLNQQALPPALGLGKNNLGDDLQIVLQLEGDNTAHIVHDPDDLTRDTLHRATDGYSGHTAVIYEQKRIIIRPDTETGEYAVDLFPVKYKVTQATATGYASLLDVQAGMPTFDLTDAPLTGYQSDYQDRHATYNARFDRIYRNPIQVGVQQFIYGMKQDGLGEQKLVVSSMYDQSNTVNLYQKDSTGTVNYLFGHPIFLKDHSYQFRVGVYEDYYYNNDKQSRPDRVRLSGGTLKVYNGFKTGDNTVSTTYALDDNGEALISAEVDNLNLQATGDEALRTIDLAIEREGSHTDYCAVRGYVTGNVVENGDIRAADTDIKILDILRDPAGSGSSCYLEKGATYKSSSTFNVSLKAGININFKIGSAYDQSVGIISVATYSGVSTSAGKTYSFNIPIVFSGKYNRSHSYTYTTSEKISTNSSPSYVGATGDVFIGHANEVLYGTVRAIRVIDDSTYLLRKPAIDEGYIKQIASAVGTDGKTYHFVIAKETVLGSGMGTQFAYTQKHISTTLIPKLIRERNALLIDAPDSVTAQKLADKQGKAIYWNLATTEAEKGTKGKYKQIIPTSVSDYNEVDKVGALNAVILRWVAILAANEREKVMAKQSGKKIGTYSVSGGTSQDYSESFSADWTEGGNLAYGIDLAQLKEGFKGNSLKSEEGLSQYGDAIQSLVDQQGQDQDLANNALNEVKQCLGWHCECRARNVPTLRTKRGT
ncbi:MAG: carboxypeptidase regulatory-like domain-containing protein [Paludibacteraceae bacterium]|nr:carboxypeptidase regulatory-like domain-containing protein [Paludibacteraceae bacterium]